MLAEARRQRLCSPFIRSKGGDCQAAVHGMIGAWSRSSRSLSNFLQTPLGWQFSYLDRPSRCKRRIYFSGGSWLYSKSAVFSQGG